MRYVSWKNKNLIALAGIFLLMGTVGCGQSVDQVSIAPRNPASPVVPPLPRVFIPNADTQGGSAQTPVGGTRVLGIHSFGGSNLRTSSVSPSFRMTGGVGVD